MNQADVSNTNTVFTVCTTLVNRREVQPERDFKRAVENKFIQKSFTFVKVLKQQQQQ